jgi:Protein of unknown function (DUF1565)
MKRLGFAFGSCVLLVSILATGACSNISDDCETTSTCGGGSSLGGSSSGAGGKAGSSGHSSGSGGAAGEGATGGSSSGMAGTSGDAGAGGGGGECDVTASPMTEVCLVSDEHAIFVAPAGNDDDAGTKAAPFASLTKAVEAAAGKLVLVCSGTYDEHVNVTAGVRAFGGFDCTDWSPSAAKPLFKPTTAGAALEIDTITAEVLLEGLAFEVGDAVATGETALTALVKASPKVTLRSVSLTAGKGKSGGNGTLTEFVFPNATALDGNPENPATMGGAEKLCACQPGLMSVGGLGGPPATAGTSGSAGLPGHGGGVPGQPGSCVPNGGGSDGNDAPAADAAAGAATLGTPSASGWLAASGIDGATGQPGQGGGGGASRNASGHGGGGGCGGCGGNGGTAGKGGGGSIALLAFNSPVVVEASTLLTADAGNGGGGAEGQPGQADIGAGGGVVSSINSCPGGNGGKGGAGAAGGGGAGGISVGIVWKGAMQPTVSADTTITNGKAGDAGPGGVPGTNDGMAGVAQKVLPLN